jgi:hypothetical protein
MMVSGSVSPSARARPTNNRAKVNAFIMTCSYIHTENERWVNIHYIEVFANMTQGLYLRPADFVAHLLRKRLGSKSV